MSAILQTPGSFPVSDKLLGPLRQVSKRQWQVAAAVAGLQVSTLALLALLGGALLLGEFQRMPGLLRVPIAAVVWAMVFWSLARFVRPALRRWSLAESALHVETKLPEVQERISSAVELAGERDERFAGSRSLIAHLISQAELDAQRIKPGLIVPNDRIRRWAICLAPVALAWLVLAIAQPRMMGAGVYRLFRPLAEELPAALSDVVVAPGDVTLSQGDVLEVSATLRARAASNDNSPGATLVTRDATGSDAFTSMSAISPRQFKLALTDVQQTFQYRVRGSLAASDWFTATVHPRPAVASLDVRYDFPAYSGMEAKVVKESDGTIEGLAGTKVTLTIHATGPLIDKGGNTNQLLIDEFRQTRAAAALANLSGNDYEASFILTHSGQYRVQLCNEFGLTNRDDQARSFIAHFDQPPTIVIQSPSALETVRPDDVVSVHFLATDDFAVTSIAVIVQADDGAPQEHLIRLGTGDHKLIRGVYPLSVEAIVAQSNVADVGSITYQLKATDSRDPDPQTALTAKQVLLIDRNTQSFSRKEDQMRARELNQVIDQATQQLNEAEQRSSALRNDDPNHVLSKEERRLARDARQKLDDANQELHDAADQQQETPFAAVGQEAREIADQPIQKATEHVAKAEFAEDRPQEHADEAKAAQQQIAAARDRLGQLRADVAQVLQKAEAALDLQQAAKLQADAARGLAENPAKNSQNQQKQQQAIQKLQEAMQKDPGLRDPAAQQLGQHLADLANHIQNIQRQQHQEVANRQQAPPEQQQLADQSQQAAHEAQALAQEAGQSEDADVAHRAGDAERHLEQASGEQQQAAHAQQNGDAAHAGEHQQAAAEDLNHAQSALRGLNRAETADAQPESGHGNQTAAQRAEEAAAVQPQALQSDAGAAQEAANALAQAATADAQPDPDRQDQDKTTGQQQGSATDVPLPALVSAQGIAVQDGKGGSRSEAVMALGISAGDWARLPTLLRGELMNAAQESGPPTYREMIKNYFVRIAREQAETSEPPR